MEATLHLFSQPGLSDQRSWPCTAQCVGQVLPHGVVSTSATLVLALSASLRHVLSSIACWFSLLWPAEALHFQCLGHVMLSFVPAVSNVHQELTGCELIGVASCRLSEAAPDRRTRTRSCTGPWYGILLLPFAQHLHTNICLAISIASAALINLNCHRNT